MSTPPALTIAVALATPLLAFLGVLVGNWVTRRGAKELDTWRRREETSPAPASAGHRPGT